MKPYKPAGEAFMVWFGMADDGLHKAAFNHQVLLDVGIAEPTPAMAVYLTSDQLAIVHHVNVVLLQEGDALYLLRKQALAKLTTADRKVLGLED